ncbi:MAG: protein translocase subunit SecF [Microthrixaceae bacterium]
MVFFIIITLYISWQLEWRMAVAALLGVAHDVLLTLGFYSVFGFEVTPATVISVLTILGFSLYDTIVVYDRVRENVPRFERSGRHTYRAILIRSLNQVLGRSLNTTFVAILPVAAILVIGGILQGQSVMMDFSLAMLVGLVFGAYSTVAISSPFLVWLKEREPRYSAIRQRLRDRGEEEAADHLDPSEIPGYSGPARRHTAIVKPTEEGALVAEPPRHRDDVEDGSDASPVRSGREAAAAAKAAQYQRPTPPRPRKAKKR